ncbi:MAG: GAF domain-containing protein [Chloroflexi bacterium]|nr:GAF domain-containing protein [Chloroflexota bacterium]
MTKTVSDTLFKQLKGRPQIHGWLSRRPRLAEIVLFLSLFGLLGFLLAARPSISFYALLLAPIALAAVKYEFTGGTLAALIAVISMSILIAFDPDAGRRAANLQAAWPILIAYLAVGPLIGWLAAHEREQNRDLIMAGQQLQAEQARLYQTEHKWAQQLGAISDASRQIAATLDLDRTLQLVMEKACETLPMDAGALFQFDSTTQLYKMPASINVSENHAARITFALNEGVPGWVINHQESLVIADAANDERVHPYILEEGVQSVLAIPLIAREKSVGVLTLYGKTKTHAFDDEALRLAQVYADQAAVFIENARLLAELKLAAAGLEARVERRTQQLRETQAQVVRAEKLAVVGRLAASVAHEVNNPLQAITLHLQLVADEGLSESGRQEMGVVQQELGRIADIVQRLLEFQRPKQGNHTIQDVNRLLADVLALAGKQLQQANVVVVHHDSSEPALVTAVGDQLKQVFLNIILNAIQAMPNGGELLINNRCQEQNWIITFSDAGSGMTPDIADQLFEPFFSTKHNGTGLGLAVSHEIVTAHGGMLTAVSQPNQGAIFTISLPTAAAPTGDS